MSSFGLSNGAASRGSFNSNYDGGNDYGSMMSYQEDHGPQIYRVRFDLTTRITQIYSFSDNMTSRRCIPTSRSTRWR